MKATLFALSMPLLMFALPASAAEPPASCPINEDGIPECPKPALELGARTGVALPLGSVASGSQLNETLDAQIPVQIDFGFRPDPHLFVGAYGSFGFVLPASGVCQGEAAPAATSARDWKRSTTSAPRTASIRGSASAPATSGFTSRRGLRARRARAATPSTPPRT